jgi:hypothetical protein
VIGKWISQDRVKVNIGVPTDLVARIPTGPEDRAVSRRATGLFQNESSFSGDPGE